MEMIIAFRRSSLSMRALIISLAYLCSAVPINATAKDLIQRSSNISDVPGYCNKVTHDMVCESPQTLDANDHSALFANIIRSCDASETCRERCFETGINVTSDCNCDPSCNVRRDCCWDYQETCAPRVLQKKRLPSFAADCLDNGGDGIEHMWTVTECASDWSDEVVKKRCHADGFPDFIAWLPVIGDSGWVYKNLYCAHCNYITKLETWPIYVECYRRVPTKILHGDIEVLSDYLVKFCDMKLANASNILRVGNDITVQRIKDSPVGHKIQALINDFVVAVRRCIPTRDITRLTFGKIADYLLRKEIMSMIDCSSSRKNDDSDVESSPDEVATVGWTSDDQHLYWVLSNKDDIGNKFLSSQSHGHRKKRWIPPSYSLLLQFHQPSEVVYRENENITSTTVNSHCQSGEIYDPLYSSCRTLFCAPNQQFTGTSCVDMKPTKPEGNLNPNGRSVESTAKTVTLIVEIPKQNFTFDQNKNETLLLMKNDVQTVVDSLSTPHQTHLENVTITEFPLDEYPDEQKLDEENMEDGIAIGFSFVIFNGRAFDLTDEEIVSIAANISSSISFRKLLLITDWLQVLVVDSYLADRATLVCAEDRQQIVYHAGEYNIVIKDEMQILHVLGTDNYYAESEYQFLDWVVSIDKNGTKTTFVDQSRALVCVQVVVLNQTSCTYYTPLNQSEYQITKNGEVYLPARNKTIPKDQYVIIEGTLAVCVDDYIYGQNETYSPRIISDDSTLATWIIISVWINFCLSVLSLISLVITFITYLIFADLRTVAGCCVMNLAAAQFLAMSSFMTSTISDISESGCTAVAILIHLFFLSSFFWNNVIAFDVWRTFGLGLKTSLRRYVQNRRMSTAGFGSDSGKKTVYKYMCYAWGTPLAIVFSVVMVELFAKSLSIGYDEMDSYYSFCWISNPLANIVVFGVPILLILIANGVFFGLTIKSIRMFSRGFNNDSKTQSRKKLPSVSDEDPHSPSRRIDNFELDCQQTERDVKPRESTTSYQGHRISKISVASNASTGRRISSKHAKSNVMTYIKMSTLMGFSWVIGLIGAITELRALWLLFDFSVSLQGIFILLAFICKKKIRSRYRILFSKISCCSRKE